MDSREPHQQPQLPNMMVGPTSYPSMLAPATARFPFINTNHHHHNHNPPPPPPPPPPEPLNDINNNNTCEAALKPCALGVGSSESSKKKRGRPRKYSPDGNIALGLVPNHAAASSAEPPAKKHRGRPPGSGKKQMDALGISGTGFTPHVISAEAGEDIAAKIMAFCEQGPRTVCILSAIGPIRNVTIRQPPSASTLSGPDVSYEGEFEIISLSGFTQQSENNSGHNGIRSLNVSLAGPDGRVLGGEVAGALTAASAVQVVVGSFIADGKKSSSSNLKSGRSTTPSSQLLTFGAPTTPTTPTSQGPSTESSEDNENSNFIKGPGVPGLFNNASQPIHNLPMYPGPRTYGEEIIDHKMLKCERRINEHIGTIDFVEKGTENVVFRTCDDEKDRVVFQIGTSDAVRALTAAQLVCNDVAAIDINMGCPKAFSVSGGMGAALLSKPELIHDILTTLRRNLNTPVTCKIRLLKSPHDTVELARRIEKTGVSALAVHGRKVTDRPKDPAKWNEIADVVSALSIPVIANGDVFEYDDFERIKSATSAPSVMVARGAIWNASIFSPEGKVLHEDVKREYIRKCILWDNDIKSTKFTVREMIIHYSCLELAEGRAVIKSESTADLAELYGQKEYYQLVKQGSSYAS